MGEIFGAAALLAATKSPQGRPSVIQKHCLAAMEKKHTKCIWLCMKRHGRTTAKDIPYLSKDGWLVTSVDLRKQFGWWKKYSLYSATAIKEVKIRFRNFDEVTNEIAVTATSFDHKGEIEILDRCVDKARGIEMDPFECGVDIMGVTHDRDDPQCPNSAMDPDVMKSFCMVQHARDIEVQREESQWLSAMLEYYWRGGIEAKDLTVLEKAGFVTSYSNLCVETYFDAASAYGKTVNGFMLVEEWQISYLLCLVAASLACSICIAAIGWVYGRSMEAGLTAGTYAVTVTAVPLGVLTFLSAVL